MLSTFLGYGSFLLLGWLVLKPKDRHKPCLFTLVYWTMLSLAAWCALFGRRPPPLGEDAAQTGGGAVAPQSFRNFMPSWMILPSGLPTLSRSRPS